MLLDLNSAGALRTSLKWTVSNVNYLFIYLLRVAKNLNVPGISLNKFSKAVLLNSRNVRWKEVILLRFRCSFNPVLCCRNQRRKSGFSLSDLLFFSFLLDVCQAWRGPRPGSTCNGDIRESNESRVTRGTVWSKIPCSQEIYYNNATNILMPLLMLTLWQKNNN